MTQNHKRLDERPSISWAGMKGNVSMQEVSDECLDPENHLGNEKERHLNQSSILFQRLVFRERQHEGCSGSEPCRLRVSG